MQKYFFLILFLNICKLLIISFIKDKESNNIVEFDNENQSFLFVKVDLENQLAIKNELLDKFQFDLNSAKVFFSHFFFKYLEINNCFFYKGSNIK